MMMVRQVIAGGIDTIKFIPAIRDIGHYGKARRSPYSRMRATHSTFVTLDTLQFLVERQCAC